MRKRLSQSHIRLALVLAGVLALVLLAGLPGKVWASARADGTIPFGDVPPEHWAYTYINILSSNGITSGCAINPPQFCPNDPTTRAQMAVFLLRGAHGGDYVPPQATDALFNDVPLTHWAVDWINQLALEGITSGCGGGNYCPENNVTRAEMAVFLLRSKYGAGYTPPPATGAVFDDVPVTHWAAAWIEQLYAEGITGGCSQTPLNYCPNQNVTRAEMAVFLVRTFNLTLLAAAPASER